MLLATTPRSPWWNAARPAHVGSPPPPRAEHERTMLQRQIEATDRQIDGPAYELYGLTEEEIKIVEEAAK